MSELLPVTGAEWLERGQRWRGRVRFPDSAEPSAVLIFRHGEGYLALPAACPHEGQDLSECPLDDQHRLTCTRHGLRLNLAGRDGFRVERRGEAFAVPWPLQTGIDGSPRPAAVVDPELARLREELEAVSLAKGALEEALLAGTEETDRMLREVEAQRNDLRFAHETQRSLSTFIQRVMDTVGGLLVVLGPDGRVRLTNHRCGTELGARSLTEGLTLDQLLDPAEAAALAAALPALPWPVHSPLFETLRIAGSYQAEHRLRRADGGFGSYLIDAAILHSPQGREEGAVVSAADITRLKEQERALEDHARFLESLEWVSRVLARRAEGATLLPELAEVLLQVFQADRAFFVHPLDPGAPHMRVLAEATRSDYPGAAADGANLPIDATTRALVEEILKSAEPLTADFSTMSEPPATITRYRVQSMMVIALWPEHSPPWALGLHQCSGPRQWSAAEQQLFRTIAQRIGDALASHLLHESLKRSEASLNQAQHLANLGSWDLDLAGDSLHWSDEVFHIFEIDQTRFAASYEAFLNAIHPDDRDRVNAAYLDSVEKRTPYDVVHRLLMPDGRIKHVHERCQTFYDDSGRPVRSVGTVQDITERKRAEDTLRQWAAVFQNTQEGVLITDCDLNIVAINRAFTTITGYTEPEVIGRRPATLLKSGHHDQGFYEAMWQELDGSGVWQGELWDRRKDGSTFPTWLTISAVRDENGRVVNYIGVFADITLLKKSQQELEYLAHHDPLTGLSNRLLCTIQLDQAVQRAERAGNQIAVLFLDLDRFKHVNDSLGHPVGDALLQAVAGRLREQVRGDDVVARLGGDEFTVVMQNLHDDDMAVILAERLIQALCTPFVIRGHELSIGTSIGISLYPRDGTSGEVLLKNADAAMYRAKEAGRNTFRFYAEEMTARALEKVTMEVRLRHAIEQQELVLHYQPQMNLASGRLIGLEALVRWQHPELGLVSPAQFIPLAEETGLIVPLGEWVLKSACAQGAAWLAEGRPFGRIAVNIAGPQMRTGDIAATVGRVLADSGLPPACLELEITETFIMGQAARAIEQLQALRDLGVVLAIDDFGTGYSSLSYLKRLPIHKLKLDQSFVRGLPADDNDAAIARAVIALGHSLQFSVLAEGVETVAQRDFLRNLGCDEAQGYLFSRPVSPDKAVTLLPGPGNA
jgi:diguanylate cyclase (GGDEF)-like protein/PAS domain S-box-containing protein